MGAKARLTQSHAGRQAGPSNQPACAEAFFLALCHIRRERRGGWGGVEPGSPTGEKTWRRRERGGEERLSTRCTYLDVCPSAIPNEGGWVVVLVVMVGVVVVAVEVLLVVVEAVAGGRERQLVAGQSVRGGRQRGAAVAVRCVLRLQQQCSVQCAVQYCGCRY